MSRSFVFFCLSLLGASGHAQEQGQPKDGPPHEPTGGMRTMTLVTPNKDWQEKWDTPRETLPYFNETSGVATGGSLFLITFL